MLSHLAWLKHGDYPSAQGMRSNCKQWSEISQVPVIWSLVVDHFFLLIIPRWYFGFNDFLLVLSRE